MKRINYLDIVKGIGILLVIFGHSFRDVMREQYLILNFLYGFIYSFHMPLFFFVSGFIYNYSRNNNKFEQIKNKFYKLVIPFVFYSTIIYLIFLIVNYIPIFSISLANAGYRINSFISYAFNSLLGNNPFAFHLWYLIVLFIFFVIIIFIKNNKNLLFALLIASLVFRIIPLHFNYMLFTGIKNNLPYFILGYLGYNFDKWKKNNSLFFIIGVAATALFTYFVVLNQTNNSIIIFALTTLNSFVGIPFMIMSIINLSKKINSNKFLEKIGKNSFNIYLLHQPFFCGFLGTILISFMPNTIIMYLVIMTICILLSIIGSFIILKLISILKLERIAKKCLCIQYIK